MKVWPTPLASGTVEALALWSIYDIEYSCAITVPPVITTPSPTITPTQSPSSSCGTNSIPTEPSWVCVNGKWTANGTQEIGDGVIVLEVPLTVTGNLNVTSNQSRIVITYDDKPAINVSGMLNIFLCPCVCIIILSPQLVRP